ncbi:MAG: hypothetical protein TUN42_04295 [Dehalogenimonas sp.]
MADPMKPPVGYSLYPIKNSSGQVVYGWYNSADHNVYDPVTMQVLVNHAPSLINGQLPQGISYSMPDSSGNVALTGAGSVSGQNINTSNLSSKGLPSDEVISNYITALATSVKNLTGDDYYNAVEAGLKDLLGYDVNSNAWLTGQAGQQLSEQLWDQFDQNYQVRQTLGGFWGVRQEDQKYPQYQNEEQVFLDWLAKQPSNVRAQAASQIDRVYQYWQRGFDPNGNVYNQGPGTRKQWWDTVGVPDPYVNGDELAAAQQKFDAADKAYQAMLTPGRSSGVQWSDNQATSDAMKLSGDLGMDNYSALKSARDSAQENLTRMQNANRYGPRKNAEDPWLTFLNNYNWNQATSTPNTRTSGQGNRAWWAPTTRWNVF